MSKTWKWILGIVIVLLLLAAFGGASFVAMRAYNIGAARAAQASQNGSQSAGNPGNWRMPMHGNYGGYQMPYHQRGFGGDGYPRMGVRGGFGMMPFGMGFFWLGGLFRLIIPLGMIALVLFLGYQWGKRAGDRRAMPAAAPVETAPPAPTEAGSDDGGESPP
jgi:hypothetical protein